MTDRREFLLTALAGVSGALAAPHRVLAGEVKTPKGLVYPAARTVKATETLSGVSFPDPYRWLENDTDEVRRWQRAQAGMASAHVGEWPHVDALRNLIARFSVGPPGRLPRYAAGRWFGIQATRGSTHAMAVMSDQPFGEARVLFDPATENRQKPGHLSWLSPSPDGHTLALGVIGEGEINTIRLIDVATGDVMPDAPQQTLMDHWTGGVHWLPDSSGFCFSAIAGTAIDFTQDVYWHRRGPRPATERLDIPWVTAKDYRLVVPSSDGQYAIAMERLRKAIPVAIARISDLRQWKPFVTTLAGNLSGHLIGRRYIGVTSEGAPRGRLVAVDLDSRDPNDPAGWQELVPESDAVIRTVTPVGNVLYLSEFVDTYARVRIVDLDGKVLSEVPLPSRGALETFGPTQNTLPAPQLHPDKFLFGFSSPTDSIGLYSHTPGNSALDTLAPPQVRIDNVVVEDAYAVSADGTRIPYRILRRRDIDASRPRPTMIHAYGGLNGLVLPKFPGAMAAFVAASGLLVYAHLRGGGELGNEWWQGGRMAAKQNTYDDLFAIAENLIATRRSTPQLLAMTGGSNGGITAGVAATQRPDLWKVVVPRVPLTDLIGACRNPYDRMVLNEDFAELSQPSEVRRLASFSPYHLVREGARYPAILIEAGGLDPRCPPWHALKLAARLQRANRSDNPILVHVREDAGHGGAAEPQSALDEQTEWLGFVMRHLGMGWDVSG